jgi:peptidoglycan recognition protein
MDNSVTFRIKMLIIFAAFAIFLVSVNGQCPNFVTRNVWAARSPAGLIPVITMRPAPYLIVHQTGPITTFCNTQATCSQQSRNAQNNHMDVEGWPDVAFSFMVGEDNLIYTGRGWVQQGQNLGPFATQAVNVAYIGNFDGRQPNLSSRRLLDSLISCGITANHLRTDVKIVAACQIQGTSCVTNSIHGWLRDHPRFEENPQVVV